MDSPRISPLFIDHLDPASFYGEYCFSQMSYHDLMGNDLDRHFFSYCVHQHISKIFRLMLIFFQNIFFTPYPCI